MLSMVIVETQWEQTVVEMYGKKITTPRLTAWYGDEGSTYKFSGKQFYPKPWTPLLLKIKARVEEQVNSSFNSVLLNFYRNGDDSVAWHSDNEPELGMDPLIASVSFGQMRRFDIRSKTDHQLKYSVNLENGSLLLMKGDLQQKWEHRIAKSTQLLKERVNLTFRNIYQ